MPQYVWIGRTKNQILDVGYDNNGKKYKRKVKFRPSCYIESNNPNCDIRTIYGQATQKIEFDSIQDYQKYVSTHKTIAQGTIDPCIQYIHENYSHNDLNIKLRVLIVDIEVIAPEFPNPDEAKYEINSCSMLDNKTGLYYVVSLKEYDKTKNKIEVDPENIRFKLCQNEVELLRSIIKIVQHIFPDALNGWNSSQFDYPYIINRLINVLGYEEASSISPFGRISSRKITKKNKQTHSYEEYFICEIDGIILLDYMEMYKKYTFEPRESFALDFIATEELGDGKVDYSEFDNLNDMWIRDQQKFIDYNIVDVKLIKELDDKLGLVDLNSMITYKAKCNHADTMGTLKPWECFLYNVMLDKKICLPIRQKREKEEYPGAYVKEPECGLYKWVVSFDFNSLYPTVIRQYNISPETFLPDKTIDVDQNEIDPCFFLDDFKNEADIVTGSGNFFRKDKIGIIPQIVEELFFKRKDVQKLKKKYEKEYEKTKDPNLISSISQYDNEQMAYKIFLNSLYGAMANKNFIFYDIRFARSITLSAQLQTKFIENYILESDFKKYSIKSSYCDTDSIYLCLEHLVDVLLKNKKIESDDKKISVFLNDFANNKIQPVINDGCNKLAEKMNSFQYMNMGREIIAKSAFWLKKKKYSCLVIDKEGIIYKEPKLKVTGIEIVRSSTPASVKPFLRNIVKSILTQEDIVKYVKTVKKDFMKLDIEKIAFPRSANSFDKWFSENQMKSGIPIGVRAAITFNQFIDKHNLESQFTKIKSGDKIKFLYMKMPNIVGQDVCGFLRRFPKELHKYVDKEMMWEKAFMNIIKSMCLKLNIPYEESKNINNLF